MVKLPYIGPNDYEFATDELGVDSSTHVPTGVVGYGDDRREAYKAMLRALYTHFEKEA